MPKKFSVLFILASFLFYFFGQNLPAQGSFFMFNTEKAPIAFFSTIEQKKKLLEKLQEDLAAHNKKIIEINPSLQEEIRLIEQQIETTKYSLSYVRDEQEASLKNKKITILSEIKQTLIGITEELKDIGETLAIHIKATKEYIEMPKKISGQHRVAYSWQELREAQLATAELGSKLDAERRKKEDLAKQKNSENEAINSLQKRLEVQSKEHAKNSFDDLAHSGAKAGILLKISNEIFNLESSLLQKKIEAAKIKMTRLEAELAAKNDEVELLDIQLQNKKTLLALMEKTLSITAYDVEGARTETNLTNQKAIQIKEALTKKIEEKKGEKSELVAIKSKLQRKLKDFSDKDRGTSNGVGYHVTQSEIHRNSSAIHVIDREIDFLNIKKELADLAVHGKEVVAHDIEIRFKLMRGRASAQELMATFKNHRDIAISLFKKMKDKHEEVLKSYGDRSKALEDIRTIQVKINNISRSVFADYEKELEIINQNLELSRQAVTTWFALSQEYLAASTDYLARYEKILAQYDLIVENLENHSSRFSLWKRSPEAITVNAISKAFIEADSFIKHFFFATPEHLGVSVVLKTLKSLTWQHLLNLILLIIFFILFTLCIKGFLHIFTQFLKKIQSSRANEKALLYATIGIGTLQFLKKYLVIISTWTFLYLHISFDFYGPFKLLKPYALPYYISLFFLSGIPLFIILSRNLLSKLKDLNKKISFLSFPENFQERLELLLAAYCYTFAILIPLRQAAWHLLPHASLALTQFLSALQVSTLILLPVLIFNKDHFLYLLPASSTATQWFKTYVEKYYYPVAIFLVVLFLLSRQFIGYANLAAFLSFSVPATAGVFYGMFICHSFIRKNAVFIFMKENEDDLTDKFEHAKTYYGFFVIFSFLILLLLSAFVIARIWEFNVTIKDFWKFLSETLVVPIGVDKKLGLIQFITLILFIVGGFLASSAIYRFVLNRLFDILRTEPGTQNTVTKIVHYLTISLSILLGCVSIHLEQLIWYVGTMLAVGLGFALKDILSDYVAGLFVLIERPLEIGNFVRIDNNQELQGTVHKIDARTVTIMTRLNHSIIISNKDLVNKVISNWGKGRFAVGFEIRILIDYSSNVDVAKQAIIEVLQSNPVVLRVPNIIVRMEEFEENGVYFLARAFISSRRVQEQWNIAASLREDLFKSFREKGIRFGMPQRVLHTRSEQQSSPMQFSFDR